MYRYALALAAASLWSCSPVPFEPDAGAPDAGRPDSGLPDAGPHDAGTPDAGPADSGTPADAGTPDGGVSDAGTPDAGSELDAGTPDSGCAGGYLNSSAPNACPLSCSAAVTPVPDEGATHIPFGTVWDYQHNPPASGPHWPSPAAWGVHSEVLPREWWVHNLEHGGIVLLYNCPYPADAGIAADAGTPPQRLRDRRRHAHRLLHERSRRQLVRPILRDAHRRHRRPLLPSRFAAVSWDWVFLFDAVDPHRGAVLHRRALRARPRNGALTIRRKTPRFLT